MKRSPLKRTESLKRSGRLKAHRRPARTPAEAEQQAAWKAEALLRGCQVCLNTHRGSQELEGCGEIQGHHVVPQQTLKRRGLAHLLWDRRNLLGAGERCHSRHTTRVEPIPRARLTADNEAFALEHALGDVLERLYA